ncbi:MAG: UV DNA damage repair endonuclease UvsE [Spirochaetales bacterium]|nr:UV DNA damage repair endonuclease UvsE [Spirochaetales bacterium]
MIRAGLCCLFKKEPVTFRQTTYRYLRTLTHREQRERLSLIALHNAHALYETLLYCRDHGIGDFRITSRFLPLATHPACGYGIEDLPEYGEIERILSECHEFSRLHDIRLTFHPDQFVLLNSPSPDVTAASIGELVYQAELAERVGADVITLHAGGVFGDKPDALNRLYDRIPGLPAAVKTYLALENDDRSYTPEDILSFCERLQERGNTRIPFVYDVHHHRCLPDGLAATEVTERAIATWNREPLFHISSPIAGWGRPDEKKHHDFIDPKDIPASWPRLDITVEVEAKAKEFAVLDFIENTRKMIASL